MTRRGIPRLYSLPPTLPARTSPPLPSARRDEVSVRGAGQASGVLWLAGFSGSGWAARGRGLARFGRRGGEAIYCGRAGWRGLAVWTAHFGAACQNCIRRSPNGPGRTRPAAMESSSPGRSRVRGLGWPPPGGRHLTPRDLGRRSRGGEPPMGATPRAAAET